MGSGSRLKRAKFEPVRDFIVVLVTCKNEEDPIKNGGARVLTSFSPFALFVFLVSRSCCVALPRGV